MLRGILFFLMSAFYAIFFGHAMQNPDLKVSDPKKKVASLLDTTSFYFATSRELLKQVKNGIPSELQERIRETILEKKIKSVLFPFELDEPQQKSSIEYHGVCGLEGVSSANQIISISCDGKITFCPERDLDECAIVTTNLHPYSSCVQKNKKRLFIGGLNGHITMWDCDTYQFLADISSSADTSTVASLSLSDDEAIMVAGCNDGTLQIWDVDTDIVKRRTQVKHNLRAIKGAYLTMATKKLVSASSDGSLRNWDIITQKQIATYQITQNFLARMVLLDGENQFVCAHDGMNLSFGDLREQKINKTLKTGTGVLYALLANKDGQHLISGGWDGMVKVWDIRMLARAATIFAHKDWVQSLSELDNLKKIISGSRDNTVKVWNISAITTLNDMPLEKTITFANILEKSAERTKKEDLDIVKLFSPY